MRSYIDSGWSAATQVKAVSPDIWFSLTMLVKDNNKIGQYGAFLPMYYRTNDCFRQGAPGCPDDNTQRTATNRPFFLYHSLPAPTATVPISTALMPAISQWLNGWAKTNQFVGCTAKPAADASVSAKAHSCNTPSCPKRTWCALSNASAMAVLLKQRQTSVRWIPAPYSGCWKEQVNVPQISIVCSLKTLMSLSKRYRWMNYTAKQSKLNAGPLQLKFPESDANAVVKKGQDVASYGSGREKQVSSGIYHWSTHPSNGNAIDRLGGDLCQGQAPSVDLDRRSSAVPTSYPSGLRADQTPPSQTRQRQTQASSSQAACGVAGRRCEENSGLVQSWVTIVVC